MNTHSFVPDPHDAKAPTPLFPFQERAVRWLAPRKTALLAFDMGLGKTAIAIRASEAINAKSILVLCPSVAVENWKREFRKWSVSHPKGRTISIFSYGSLHKVPKGYWDLCILDESHYLKSPDAERTKSVLARGGILNYAAKAWCLSGTPCPNHAAELWPILFAFGLTKLRYQVFLERFCNYYEITVSRYHKPRKQITGTKTQMIPELKRMLSTFMLRETKETAGIELPAITYDDIIIEEGFPLAHSSVDSLLPGPGMWDKLIGERDRLQKAVDEMGEKDLSLGDLMTSLPTLRRFTGLQKVRYAAEMLATELHSQEYDKVVVFAVHREVISQLALRLKDFGAVRLQGGMTDKERQAAIDKFQTDPQTRVIVVNLQAGGIAISLTAASQVVFVEQDWTPGVNAQGVMRCHRIGSKFPVHVRFLALSNSLDDRITTVLRRKTQELTQIFSG